MTYDDELTLIGKSETRATVLCNVKSASQNEFYKGRTDSYRPELVFIIHKYEYDDQQKVEFNGKVYSVVRAYAAGFEEIELVVERKMSDVKNKP